MTSKNVHQLLIFGNGFDLYNHIDSRFSDFIKIKYRGFNDFLNKYDKELKNNSDKYKYLFGKYISNLIEYKNAKVHESNPVIQAINNISADKFNYWVFCLLLNKYNNVNNWSDIEKYLYTSLITRHEEDKRSLITDIYSLLIDSAKGTKSYNYNIKAYLLCYFILLNCLSFSKDLDIVQYLRKIKIHASNYDDEIKCLRTIKSLLYEYFRCEMIDFDLTFNDYMVEQFHKSIRSYKHLTKKGLPRKERISKLYHSNSYNLICKLLKDFVYYESNNAMKFNDNKVPFNILDFNYTNPVHNFSSKLYVCRHIHGSLLTKYIKYVDYGEAGELNQGLDKGYKVRNALNNFRIDKKNGHLNRLRFHMWCYSHDRNIPIIGIDGSNVQVQSLEYAFTKTYNILRRNYYGRRGLLPKNIRYIKFFGHSLSKADYSYFEDIFDKYDIFNRPIMLVFYYSPYTKTDNKGQKYRITDLGASLSQLHNISKLFEHYCKVKGLRTNTLLSRLLLEGRLVIRNIDHIPNNL